MAEIERLSVVWDARFDKFEEKLNRVIRSTHGAASKIEKRLDATNDNIARRFGKGIGGTLNSELQTLAARAGPAAGALSGLGAAGLVAAAGVAALGAALVGAREAAAFSDELADTAKRLHVTTDALQEYRYAIRAAGGDEEGADEALERFSVTLGNAQRGMAKAEKAFLQLGFSKEQIASMTDADAALTAVTERINGLPLTQQDSLIKALGLEGLKPLIQDGTAEMERLRAEAHKVGVVMDAELIKRGGELNDQVETVAKVIDIQLKSALVDLGPVLVGLLQLIAKMASAAADVADAFRSIDDKRSKSLEAERSRRLERQFNGGPVAAAFQARDRSRIAAITAELQSREASNKAAPITPTRELADVGGGGGKGRAAKTARDTTLQRQQEIDRAFREVERDLLSAWQSLLVEAENRAELQRQLLDLEIEGRNAEFDKQKADIEADEGLSAAKKKELAASIEKVRVQYEGVDALRREGIDRDLAAQKAAEALSLRQGEIQAQEEVLALQADLARTAGEERVLRLQLLDLADQRVRLEQEAVIASQASTEAQREEARRRIAQLEATRGARQEGVNRSTQGPLESYFDSLPATVEQVNERMQALAADGIASVVDGLAQAAVGARSLGDVFKQVIAQMAIDLTRLNLQRALVSFLPGVFGSGGGVAPQVNGIFGYAAGGYTGGGPRGKVAGVVHGQEFVVNAEATKRNLGLLNAINAGLSPRVAGPSVRQGDTFNLGGVTVMGAMSASDARRTGDQIGAAAMARMAAARRKGFG